MNTQYNIMIFLDFIEIEDLLQNFDNPTIIDIKMGTRFKMNLD